MGRGSRRAWQTDVVRASERASGRGKDRTIAIWSRQRSWVHDLSQYRRQVSIGGWMIICADILLAFNWVETTCNARVIDRVRKHLKILLALSPFDSHSLHFQSSAACSIESNNCLLFTDAIAYKLEWINSPRIQVVCWNMFFTISSKFSFYSHNFSAGQTCYEILSVCFASSINWVKGKSCIHNSPAFIQDSWRFSPNWMAMSNRETCTK